MGKPIISLAIFHMSNGKITISNGKTHYFSWKIPIDLPTFLHGVAFAHVLIGAADRIGAAAVGLRLVFHLISVDHPTW